MECKNGIHSQWVVVVSEEDKTYIFKCLKENKIFEENEVIQKHIGRLFGRLGGIGTKNKLGSKHFSEAGKIGMRNRWAKHNEEKRKQEEMQKLDPDTA